MVLFTLTMSKLLGLEDWVEIILQGEMKVYESTMKLLLLMSERDIIFGNNVFNL